MAVEKELLKGISLLAQGEEEGFNIFYSHTYNYVYSRAKFIMKDEQDALDLTQETFIHAYKGITTLEDANNVYAWLGGIVYRQGMRIFRKKREILVNEDAEGIFEDIANEDRDISPEETTDAKATAEIVMGLIEELPELQRAAVLAYYYDNMKIEDIAKAFGCSANTIKSRLNYAKKYLKAKVEENEKKNRYRLHSVSPAIILWAFRSLFAKKNYTMPQAMVQGIYDGSCGAVGLVPKMLSLTGAVNASVPTPSGKTTVGAAKTASGAAKAAAFAGKAGMATGAKVGIAIGAVAVAVIAGAAVYFHIEKEEPLQSAIVQEDVSIMSEVEAVEPETGDEEEETIASAEVDSMETEIEVETETAESEVEATEAISKFTWRETTAERGIYDIYGADACGQHYCEETLDEILQMVEDPSIELADWDAFFKRTYFQGCDYEDLLWLEENGYTFDDIGQMIRATQGTDNEAWTLQALGILPE